MPWVENLGLLYWRALTFTYRALSDPGSAGRHGVFLCTEGSSRAAVRRPGG